MERSLLILLLAIGGTMGMGILGNRCNRNQCDHLMPNELLQRYTSTLPNSDGLKEACPPLIRVMECVKDMILDCTGETVEQLANSGNETVGPFATFFVNLLQLTYEICDKETQLHKDYVENAECFMDVALNQGTSCQEEAKRLYEVYRNSVEEIDVDQSEDKLVAETQCMTTAYAMACTLTNLRKTCGEKGKDTFLTILKRLQFLKLGVCGKDELVTLKSKFTDFLEQKGEERDFLVSAFDFRRRRK